MNTPKTPKPPIRYRDRRGDKLWPAPEEGLQGHLTSQDHLALLGLITSTFSHLEQDLRDLMAVLLSSDADRIQAGIVLASIISAKARIDLMRRLLHESPLNAAKTSEFDEIIDEVAVLNTKRNKYVHGLWYTSTETKKVFISEVDGEGLSYFLARPIEIEELVAFQKRMMYLRKRIQNLVYS